MQLHYNYIVKIANKHETRFFANITIFTHFKSIKNLTQIYLSISF